MKAYKLTNAKDQTRKETKWGPNVTHETNGEGGLCGPGWLHYYDNPLLAVMLDPIHGNFGATAHLWEAEAEGEIKEDDGRKFGCTKLTTIRQIPLLEVTKEQRIAFAILCAKETCDHPKWNEWADKWLSGEDRSGEAAANAASVATCTAYVAAYAAATATATYAVYATTHSYISVNLHEIVKEAMKYE